ncbi:MAG: DcaP family trimeric outer membrane transporter [Candidatus Polarisedimenticolia bacterium]
MSPRSREGRWVPIACVALLATWTAFAQSETKEKARLDIYGFAMADTGYETKTSDPDWFDVMRPTKLPSFEGEFGGDGRTYFSVRQTRFGVKGFIPTSRGVIKTIFEFELFGVGTDAGQTTFRLRHAWGELNDWGAGQSWSPFMDPDVFPNSLEYWGPNGMVFFRNVQIRWMPLQGENEVYVALERPGASGDPGVFSGSPEIANLEGRFPLPDLTGHYRRNADWGHVQISGIVRAIRWDDNDPNAPNLQGAATGWGINLSGSLKVGEADALKGQVVVGEGMENYMNDATVDVGAVFGSDVGEVLPIVGVLLFYDHTWSDKFTSTIGYSMVDIDNSEAQLPSAFKKGQYALTNLLYHPTEDLMWGGEVIWGDRENFDDGFSSDDLRVQLSIKYKFGTSVGG